MIISAMLEVLTATETCEEAYTRLCAQRIKHPHNADIWSFRYHWQDHRAEIISQLQNGSYRFEPMQLIHKHNGEQIVMWSSQGFIRVKNVDTGAANRSAGFSKMHAYQRKRRCQTNRQ